MHGSIPDALLSKEEARDSSFPKEISPMLATLVDRPFDDKDWVFEVKWDGVRAVLFFKKSANILEFRSRSGKIMTHRYPEVAGALKNQEILQCKDSVVLDGEIVVLDDNGLPDFQGHQRLY